MVYPGDKDFINHFYHVLPAFKDNRYITIDGKPIFVIFDPYGFKDISHFIELWHELAHKNGLKGIYFIALIHSTTTMHRDKDGNITRVLPNLKSSKQVYQDILSLGFDGINSFGKPRAEMLYMGKYSRIISTILHKKFPFLPSLKFNYPKVMRYFFSPEDNWENVYPTIFPQWDRTPRAGNCEGIYINANPNNFRKHIEYALEIIKNKSEDHKILFLRSWNEWGEGNYIEPDQTYGHGFLDALGKTIK